MGFCSLLLSRGKHLLLLLLSSLLFPLGHSNSSPPPPSSLFLFHFVSGSRKKVSTEKSFSSSRNCSDSILSLPFTLSSAPPRCKRLRMPPCSSSPSLLAKELIKKCTKKRRRRREGEMRSDGFFRAKREIRRPSVAAD